VPKLIPSPTPLPLNFEHKIKSRKEEPERSPSNNGLSFPSEGKVERILLFGLFPILSFTNLVYSMIFMIFVLSMNFNQKSEKKNKNSYDGHGLAFSDF